MSMTISPPSNSIRSLNLLTSQGARARIRNHFPLPNISLLNHGRRHLANQGMQSRIMGRQVCSKRLHAIMGNLPGATPPPSPNFPIWATWILGSIISLILPIWKLKGGFLQKIANEVQRVADAVEDVVEIVEDVAEAVEKVSSDVADSIPEKGILKDAALWVEHASKEVGEDARQTLDFIHKVDELKEEVEKDWEALVESHADEGEVAEKEIQGRKENEEKEIKAEKPNEEKEEEGDETNGRKKNEENETQALEKDKDSKGRT